ncbi:hypothetical protein STEG23_022723, partial [Scotinomys teguina]
FSLVNYAPRHQLKAIMDFCGSGDRKHTKLQGCALQLSKDDTCLTWDRCSDCQAPLVLSIDSRVTYIRENPEILALEQKNTLSLGCLPSFFTSQFIISLPLFPPPPSSISLQKRCQSHGPQGPLSGVSTEPTAPMPLFPVVPTRALCEVTTPPLLSYHPIISFPVFRGIGNVVAIRLLY